MQTQSYHRAEMRNQLAEFRRLESEAAEAKKMDELPIPENYFRAEIRPNMWGDVIVDFYTRDQYGLNMITRRAESGTQRAIELLNAVEVQS